MTAARKKTRPDEVPAKALEIVALVAQGYTNKQIAPMVGIHYESVEYHVKRTARLWRLDPTKEARVMIARRVLGIDQPPDKPVRSSGWPTVHSGQLVPPEFRHLLMTARNG
jgi:hypothetical protein